MVVTLAIDERAKRKLRGWRRIQAKRTSICHGIRLQTKEKKRRKKRKRKERKDRWKKGCLVSLFCFEKVVFFLSSNN